VIESLLADLADSGWTLSWAFQFAHDHWRVSIIQRFEWNSLDQPDLLISHCADAPSFAEALEDAMLRRNEAEFIAGSKCTCANEPSKPTNLLQALGLHIRQPKIDRRI
jgi:hypothetical protein